MSSVNSEKKPEIICHPAECWAGCDDAMCPYHHSASWEVNGRHYGTKEEAKKAAVAAPEGAQP